MTEETHLLVECSCFVCCCAATQCLFSFLSQKKDSLACFDFYFTDTQLKNSIIFAQFYRIGAAIDQATAIRLGVCRFTYCRWQKAESTEDQRESFKYPTNKSIKMT